MQGSLIHSLCPFCGVGCGIGLKVNAEGKLDGVEPLANHPISKGKLCEKGWSTAWAVSPEQRITQPLRRKGEEFFPVSWEEALSEIAVRLTEVLDESGPQAAGVISSARATNEDNYAAQKFARAVLHTHNVDHCARICHSPSVAGLNRSLGSGAMTNSIADLEQTDLVLVIGADPTENHTILGGEIIRAKLRGAKLIVIDPRTTRLAKLADQHLPLKPGSNIALINAMLHVIITEKWLNRAFVETRCDKFELLSRHLAGTTPEAAAAVTGISAEKIRLAARSYSSARSAMILYGMGITQFVSGTNNVIALSNLALVCGQIGRPGTGINPLRGQNNVQGSCDMGCLPNVFPGYQEADNPVVQEKFAKAWDTELPTAPGLTSLGMTKAALEGNFRAMILFGEDPVVTDPDQNHVREALQKLDLLVVAELRMTETARLADFILPAASFAEKNGTFTNCERRVQRVRKALNPPGEAMADWQWLMALANRMGSSQLHWRDSEAVFAEMASLTPIYSAITYPKLENHGVQWPCNEQAPNGTTILHTREFPIGRARLIPVSHTGIDELPDNDYPLLLTTNRLHCHYGCGSMTRQSPLLEREIPPGVLFIHPSDAAKLGLGQYAEVTVSSRRGEVETRAMITTEVPEGLVSMPYHFREAPSNQLTNNAQDPVTKMPELKACAVRVEPIIPGKST